MRIKGEYVLDTIGGECLAVPLNTDNGKQAGIVKLNGVGSFLWEKLTDGAEAEELVQALTDAYDVERERAARDVEAFLEKLDACGVLERA